MKMMDKPNPALRRLDVLLGTWNLTGRTLDAAEDNISGWNTFEWMPGRFFLKSVGEIDFKGMDLQSLEIIGYDEVSDTFPSQVYSSMSGGVHPYHWDVQGDTVTHWMASSKYTGTLSEVGNTHAGGWRPIEGKGDPSMAYDATMTRVP